MTILAPSLAIPPASYCRPTMKPVMFCRNSRGIPRWLHNSMKWVPFRALSEKRTPLLATTPTGYPQMREKPQTRVSPYSALNSWKRLPSTIRAITSRTSYCRRLSGDTMP